MVGQFGGASAVAIDPFWILTAAHVDGTQFVMPGIGTFNVVQDVTHPFADLRLLRVDQPMPFYSRIDMSDEVGGTVTLAGYGLTGTPRVDGTGFDVSSSDGFRHIAQNKIDYTMMINFQEGQTPWDTYVYTLDAPTSGNAVAGEGGISFGDSGGGWFAFRNGAWKLVATNDAIDYAPGTTDFYTWGALGYGIRDVEYADWIGSFVPGAVPEPASIAILGVGAVALLRRRKRA